MERIMTYYGEIDVDLFQETLIAFSDNPYQSVSKTIA